MPRRRAGGALVHRTGDHTSWPGESCSRPAIASERSSRTATQPPPGRAELLPSSEAARAELSRSPTGEPHPVPARAAPVRPSRASGALVPPRGGVGGGLPDAMATIGGVPTERSASGTSIGTDLADEISAWFRAEARDLPWRRPGTTPWGVLVSEFMLQQTPVARVEPVWTDWMARWPVPSALAAAPRADVLRAWGKLGYPRRAIRLHDAAGRDRRAARRRGPVRRRHAGGAARRRLLHRTGGRRVRVRPAGAGGGHERAPGRRPRGARRRATRARPGRAPTWPTSTRCSRTPTPRPPSRRPG